MGIHCGRARRRKYRRTSTTMVMKIMIEWEGTNWATNDSSLRDDAIRARKWKVTVPAGSSGGRALRVTLLRGHEVRIKIPDGLLPSDMFYIRHSDTGKEYAKSSRGGQPRPRKQPEVFRHVSDEASRRYDVLRNTKVSVSTWCLGGFVPTKNQLRTLVSSSDKDAGIYTFCFQMCAHVVVVDKILRRLMSRKYSCTCSCVGPDANSLYTVAFVFISNEIASKLRATVSMRTVRRGERFAFKSARSTTDESVDMTPSAVCVRVRLTCTSDSDDIVKTTGRHSSFVDLRFITFYLPKDSRLRCRLKIRNQIAAGLLSQLRDGSKASNFIEVCAGSFNYRLLLEPAKIFRTILQALSARRAVTTKESIRKGERGGGDDRRDSGYGGDDSTFWEYMYPFDEMFREMTQSKTRSTAIDSDASSPRSWKRGGPFQIYEELPPTFPPTYPRLPLKTCESPRHAATKKAVENCYCTDVVEQSTPAWSDRILWRSSLSDALKFRPLGDYRALDVVSRSCHCPVVLSFVIE
eukprot:g4193.t1